MTGRRLDSSVMRNQNSLRANIIISVRARLNVTSIVRAQISGDTWKMLHRPRAK